MAATPEFKTPKKLDGTIVDRYYSLMQKRLELNRLAAEIEAEEKFLKAYIIDTLPMSQATGLAGQLCSVTVVPKWRPEMKDFDAFTEFVAKNRKKGTFALLNRAVNNKAASEYWATGKEIPGLERVQYKSLSYSSLK